MRNLFSILFIFTLFFSLGAMNQASHNAAITNLVNPPGELATLFSSTFPPIDLTGDNDDTAQPPHSLIYTPVSDDKDKPNTSAVRKRSTPSRIKDGIPQQLLLHFKGKVTCKRKKTGTKMITTEIIENGEVKGLFSHFKMQAPIEERTCSKCGQVTKTSSGCENHMHYYCRFKQSPN